MRGLVGIVVASLMLAGAAEAQSWQPPRTADGKPDLQGVWLTGFLTQLERPPGMPGPFVTAEQATKIVADFKKNTPDLVDPDFHFYDLSNLAEARGRLLSSQIVEPADGRIPFTPAGTKSADEYDRLFEHAFDNPEERDNYERCISGMGQAPIRPFPAPIPVQIVQTGDTILLWPEDVPSLRIIHMDGAPPPPDALRSRDGYSAGRWDGDTLVVETTHFLKIDPWRPTMMRSLVVGTDSKVVERFTLLSGTELHYEFTIEDKDIYATPWKGEFSFRRDPKWVVLEYACHEANYSIVNMLKAGREDDRRARAAKPKR